ncbi:MAG: GNAT family N-acetyltransferase [Chitinophagales bacterium]
MNNLIRTTSQHGDFVNLVRELDADLAVRDGDMHGFYHQYNNIDALKYVVVLYHEGAAVSCGAIKEIEPGVMEVKRMYTKPAQRGKGLAGLVLAELEQWAIELRMKKCVLETGKGQPEAIALYKKSGYHLIPNYGQYAGVDNSVCFEKLLTSWLLP